jgi:hypothetical protein
MITSIIQDLQSSRYIFQAISTPQKSEYMLPQKVELMGYYVTDFPRLDDPTTTQFCFVYGLFNEKTIPFTANQDKLLILANDMFKGSRTLTDFEDLVLQKTFLRVAKTKPTRPNRI